MCQRPAKRRRIMRRPGSERLAELIAANGLVGLGALAEPAIELLEYGPAVGHEGRALAHWSAAWGDQTIATWVDCRHAHTLHADHSPHMIRGPRFGRGRMFEDKVPAARHLAGNYIHGQSQEGFRLSQLLGPLVRGRVAMIQ